MWRTETVIYWKHATFSNGKESVGQKTLNSANCTCYSVVLQKTRPGDKEGVEITLNSSIPYPQRKKESSDEKEYGNDAARMNTKDSSPEEQTESLLQS